jgi:predicted amidohydrolase YtcJ
MKSTRRRSRTLFPVFSASVGFRTAAVGQASDSPNGRLALVGGTIYVSPDEDPIRDGVVLIQDGKIAAVGKRASVRITPGIQTVDCSGSTITAGFWNSHVHFLERKWADAATLPESELLGRIVPGLAADLTVLTSDPSKEDPGTRDRAIHDTRRQDHLSQLEPIGTKTAAT